MMGRGVLCAIALLCLAVLGSAAGEGKERVIQHPLTNIPPNLQGVETAYWFPKHPLKHPQFEAGDPVDVVLGFHNGASEELNVTFAMGSLNSPLQPSFYVQNLTFMPYQLTVKPGKDVSLQYTFQPDPALPAREFLLAITVFYNTMTQGFAKTFFNETIDIVEPPKLIDTELAFLGIILAVLLAAAGYLLYGYLSSLGFLKKASGKRPKKAEPAARGENDSSEWLKGTNYDLHNKAKMKKESSRKELAKQS